MSKVLDSTSPPSSRAAVLEVVGGTLLAGIGIALVELLAGFVPGFASWSGAAVAAIFLGLPLLIARFRGFSGDPLGIGRAPMAPGLKLGLIAALIIAAPFAVGYDLLATHSFQQQRFAGPGVLSFGEIYQGVPPAAPGHVTVYEDGHALAFTNYTAQPVVLLRYAGKTTSRVSIQPDRSELLRTKDGTGWRLQADDGTSLEADVVIAGAAMTPVPSSTKPIPAERSRLWLLWYLLSQILVVALPEEAFFRGWVLGRLRSSLAAPKRQVFGVPFGVPHVLSALLFALIHLVVTPAPHRLLVFFPGLLFAWLAERSQAIVAPVVHHALSNTLLRLATRIYR